MSFYDIHYGNSGGLALDPVQQALQALQNQQQQPTRVTGGNWDAPLRPAVFSPSVSTVQQADPKAALDAAFSTQEKNNPILPGMGDAAVLSAQLARDPTGETARLLRAMQGVAPVQHIIPGATQDVFGTKVVEDATTGNSLRDNLRSTLPLAQRYNDFLPPEKSLQPFRPEGGFGGIPSADGMRSTLDTTLASHPEFLKLMAKEPDKAAHVYKSLTGRDFATDAKVHGQIMEARDKFKAGEVQKMIGQGAYVDQSTGKLMVWLNSEASPGISDLSGEAKPVRKLQEATPDQQAIWNEMYSRVTGRANPTVQGSKVAQQTKGFETNNALVREHQDAIDAAEKASSLKLGRPVKYNAVDQAKVIADRLKQQGQAPEDSMIFKALQLYGGQLGGFERSLLPKLYDSSQTTLLPQTDSRFAEGDRSGY